MISETGDPSSFKSQFIYHADNIFVMLQNPDKYATRTGYIAGESEGTHSIFKVEDGDVVPQSPYYVYYTLRNMRGTNINFSINHNNLDTDIVKSFASAPSDNKMVVGLFNPTEQSQTVTVNTGLSTDDISGLIHRKAVWDGSIDNCDYSEGSMDIENDIEVTLEPLSIHAIEIDLDKPLSLNEEIHTKEYYGSKTIVDMENEVDYTIEIPAVPDAGSEVFLRVGIDERPGPNDNYQIQINDHTYSYNLSNLPKKIIEGYHKMSGFIEIPVDTDHLKRSNTITLDPLYGYRMLYSSLVIKNISSPLNNASFEIYQSEDGDVSPLEGAIIKLNNYAAVTGSDGKASISELATGQYNYSVKKEGFSPVSDIVSVESDVIFTDTLEVTDTWISPANSIEVQIYPNPVKNELHIENFLAEGEVEIYSANGSLIRRKRLEVGLNSLDISGFKQGMYMVKVIIEDGVKYRKIIKL